MFELVGALSLVQLPVTGPLFLIPVFRSPNFNYIFVQELNRDGIIASFIPIDPESHYFLHATASRYRKSVGDVGVVGLFFPRNEIVVAEKKDVSHLVRNLALHSSTIFQIEARYFLDDHENRPDIDFTRGYFAARAGASWAEIERASQNLVFTSNYSRGSNGKNTESENYKHKDEENFIEYLTNSWSENSDENVNLVNEAVVFVLSEECDLEACVFILQFIHKTDRIDRKFGYEVGSTAAKRAGWDEWLVSERLWGDLLAIALRAGFAIDDQVIIRYVSSLSAEHLNESTFWLRPLSFLWRSSSWAYASDFLKNHSFSPKPAEKIARVLANGVHRPPGSGEKFEFAVNWLLNCDHRGAHWVSALISLIRFQATEELGQVALDWLKRDMGAVKLWPHLYIEAARIFGETSELLSLARRWVLTADRMMISWEPMAIYVAQKFPKDAELLREHIYKKRDNNVSPTSRNSASSLYRRLQKLPDPRLPTRRLF